MNESNKKLDNMNIRTELKLGDLACVIYRQAKLYNKEYNLGISFESYAFAGMHEFCDNYNPEMDRVWICEHDNKNHRISFAYTPGK